MKTKDRTVDKAEKNKRFILRYLRALNQAADKLQILPRYTSDPKLIESITFLEKTFPRYQVLVDEVTAEADRVIVRARFCGRPEEAVNGTPAAGKTVEVPFAIGYQVAHEKIIAHWQITDQLALLVQSVE